MARNATRRTPRPPETASKSDPTEGERKPAVAKARVKPKAAQPKHDEAAKPAPPKATPDRSKAASSKTRSSKTAAAKTASPKSGGPKTASPKTTPRSPKASAGRTDGSPAAKTPVDKPTVKQPVAKAAAAKAPASSASRRPSARRKPPQTADAKKSAAAREAVAQFEAAARTLEATVAAVERRAEQTSAGASPNARTAGRSEESSPDDKADAAQNPFLTPDVELFASNMARIWEAGGKAMSAYMRPRDDGARKPAGQADIAEIARTLGQVVERWASDPQRVASAQQAFAGGFFDLWSNTLKRLAGETVEPLVSADPKDGRFKDPEWSEHPVFDFLKQAYLYTGRWADRMVEDATDLDPHVRHKAMFYVKLLSNAASPSNFLPTNPELIRETFASKGENLVRGMTMLAEDIEAGNGGLRIRQTDTSGFEVGRNLATTPGKVVFRNDLFELIQYAPMTPEVRSRPVVIVPPWINKYYVLDLTPEKSLMRWATEQGLTVFCVSWVNPDARHATKSFDDYMRFGILTAVDVARDICGTEQVDAAGYCVGGTLLAVTLAHMAAKGDTRIATATLLTTQVDFTHAGDLKVFVDEEQIANVEAKMAEAGYLEGASMANAFNMIRSNDMIFPYLVNNYLKGKAPFPFDLLYWNSDATRMPAANHSFYLRSCYLNNELARGRMEIGGETLDLNKVTIPIYELATREDHIAPAKSVFLGAQLFGGPVRFVLAGSGHIAGVVNPPAKMKYQHWVGGKPKGELSHWLDRAEEKPGSWWPDWRAWLAASDATMIEARAPGSENYPALEDAPGSYVKQKS